MLCPPPIEFHCFILTILTYHHGLSFLRLGKQKNQTSLINTCVLSVSLKFLLDIIIKVVENNG